MDNRHMIKQVANNWQDWLSGKNYKSPFGPSLITINARNHIQYLLTRSTNCYFQQNIFSYSKITALYFFFKSIFVYFFWCFTFVVLLTAVSRHTQILANWVLLFQCFCFFWHLIVKTARTGPEMIHSPGMNPKWKPNWFRSPDEHLFYFFRADPVKIPK